MAEEAEAAAEAAAEVEEAAEVEAAAEAEAEAEAAEAAVAAVAEVAEVAEAAEAAEAAAEAEAEAAEPRALADLDRVDPPAGSPDARVAAQSPAQHDVLSGGRGGQDHDRRDEAVVRVPGPGEAPREGFPRPVWSVPL